MTTYRVVRKTDLQTVYAYTADGSVEFAEYPFAAFDHVETVPLADGTVAANTGRQITKRAFWNRFPAGKETAMRAVMIYGSPVLLAATLERLQVRVDSVASVDLSSAETIAGVQMLATEAVPETVTVDGSVLPLRLTAAEAAAILNAEPTADEIYPG